MTVYVTQDDIKNGVRKMACNCPVSIAVHRAFPGEMPAVHSGEIAYRTSDPIRDPRRTKLPPKVTHFIRRFDAGLTVEPISFDLPDMVRGDK